GRPGNCQVRFGGRRMEKDAVGYPSHGHTNPDVRRYLASRLPYCEELADQVPQVRKVGKNYVFEPTGGRIDIKQLFEKARNQAEGHQAKQRQAWERLLGLDDWKIESPILTINLTQGVKSIFRGIAPADQEDIEVNWHSRTIQGR